MYTATLTKKSVSKNSNKLYAITINCRISDGTSDVIDTDVSVVYNSNSTDLTALKNEFLTKLKVVWDQYKEENQIYAANVLNVAITNMQEQINNYLNQ